ncbi:MAG: hypothetical protein JSS81_16355 [Acidobacteria bacterium]|nr:hypothetical protein [Acidobacteriota bacterium]
MLKTAAIGLLLVFSGCYLTLDGNSAALPEAAANAKTPAPAATPVVIDDAAFSKHREKLEQKLKGRGFTVLVEKPFIVVGDEPAETVRRRSANTVKWAVDKLKQDYFTSDPAEILEIWLFRDKDSYRKHAKEFFNDEPDTPYGYYSPSNKALVMNIATGGGTLVHEIVHPLMEANFPDCPAWFNEGMGSLYEQSGEVGGHIHGYTNWRLPGLQKGLQQKIVPTFQKLTAMNDTEFYREDTGTNYAQARYLLYYLQYKNLLVKYYAEFLKNRTTDPTGYKSLQKILGEKDMNAFQKKWEAFVMKLRVGTEPA